jgi:hypothetical protein
MILHDKNKFQPVYFQILSSRHIKTMIVDWLISQSGLVTVIVGILLYKLLTWNRDFFEKRNVKCVAPVPVFGHLLKVSFQKETLFKLLQRMFYTFPGERLVRKNLG